MGIFSRTVQTYKQERVSRLAKEYPKKDLIDAISNVLKKESKKTLVDMLWDAVKSEEDNEIKIEEEFVRIMTKQKSKRQDNVQTRGLMHFKRGRK